MAELHHGGRLREASQQYGIDLEEWLDLSTGINPHAWPVPELPQRCWQRLPELDDGLELAAEHYYHSAQLLPVAGTQVAIRLLPQLRPKGRVGMLSLSYAEHARAWQGEGHEVVALSLQTIEQQLPSLDVLLLVNPNNPTGDRFSPEQLMHWREQLQQRDGWLIVDEAFIDTEPEQSLVHCCGDEGLIVLRSLGKFFGLAGIRVGFVFAWPRLLQWVEQELGPWHVSGPAREVARAALLDDEWQLSMRSRLQVDSRRLAELLNDAGLVPAGGSTLFQFVLHPDAEELHQLLAGEGIFTRLFSSPAALRFGLPGSESEWQRLQQTLMALRAEERREAV